MAVIVQRQCASAVTEMSQEAFVGSASENGTTSIQCDLRKHDLQQALGTKATRCWRKASSHVDVYELSTCHHPLPSRFILAQGSSLDGQHQRRDFTPEIQGVSTSQPLSTSVIRLACSLAVVCGVSLRHIALLFSTLCLLPTTSSSIKRWLDDLGSQWPPPEERRRQLLAVTPATACPSDGDYPLGTDHGVRVVQEEHDRILMTHDAASEHGEEARKFLEKCQTLGLQVPAAFSDDAQRFTVAIKAVSPQARFQVDHCPTVKHSWEKLNNSLLSSRKPLKAHGDEKNDETLRERPKMLWKWRWSLLKKPANVSVEEKQAIAALESEDDGFVHRFRSIIRQLVHIFDHAHSEAQAKRRLQQLRKDSQAVGDHQLEKILQCLDDHWDHALRSLRKQGMGKHRRGSNSESGMRLLRRREKNHDGMRSAATRQHYMQISQAIQSLSLDIADFIEQGPQMTALPRV